MNYTNFADDWEKKLEQGALTRDRCMKTAYICSPLSAATKAQVYINMMNARAYMFYVAEHMHCTPRAPHAYLPLFFHDSIPAERALALDFGLKLLEHSDIMLVCGDAISKGMRGEIAKAAMLDMKIITFDSSVRLEVKKLVTQTGGTKAKVLLDETHPFLSSNLTAELTRKELSEYD